MSVRFLVDEDVHGGVVSGLRRLERSIDILYVNTCGLKGTEDRVLLDLAYEQGRIVVSNDRTTMTAAFYERINSGVESAGVLIFPQDCPPGEMIDILQLIWVASRPEEWRNRLEYLPYR